MEHKNPLIKWRNPQKKPHPFIALDVVICDTDLISDDGHGLTFVIEHVLTGLNREGFCSMVKDEGLHASSKVFRIDIDGDEESCYEQALQAGQNHYAARLEEYAGWMAEMGRDSSSS